MPSRCPERVYGRGTVVRRVPFAVVTDTTPPDVATTAPLPWRVRKTRDTTGFLSPAVRRVAAERGVDVAHRRGTGAGGRLTRADVLQAAGAAGAQSPHDVVAFNRVQQRAGAALLASKHTSAHAYSIVMADYTALDTVRLAERERWRAEEGFSLTYLPFVARAAIDALREFPLVNASVGDDALVVHRDVNLGIAVDLANQGLVVPVVRAAGTLRMRGIARAVDDIARRARAKKLLPDDLSGGTFTITNPGASRTWMSFPIINQPQVAILSTDGVAKRVAIDTDGRGRDRLEVRTTGHLCLAFDERALDPTYAGAFVARVADLLAQRDWRTEL
jgi:pyruvate/2-oxoglutarate dehydrogenase complex dihydrolipoamide acyltransferase (E2) component